MRPNEIVFSVPTSGGGATPPATFSFMTSGYKVPRQGRSSGMDTVHNQNGVFRYFYDNGPNSRTWEPFAIVASDAFTSVAGGGATQQAANLDFLWQYVGPMGMQAPEGTYTVGWAPGTEYLPAFTRFPSEVGDKIELRTDINIVEA